MSDKKSMGGGPGGGDPGKKVGGQPAQGSKPPAKQAPKQDKGLGGAKK